MHVVLIMSSGECLTTALLPWRTECLWLSGLWECAPSAEASQPDRLQVAMDLCGAGACRGQAGAGTPRLVFFLTDDGILSCWLDWKGV